MCDTMYKRWFLSQVGKAIDCNSMIAGSSPTGTSKNNTFKKNDILTPDINNRPIILTSNITPLPKSGSSIINIKAIDTSATSSILMDIDSNRILYEEKIIKRTI